MEIIELYGLKNKSLNESRPTFLQSEARIELINKLAQLQPCLDSWQGESHTNPSFPFLTYLNTWLNIVISHPSLTQSV